MRNPFRNPFQVGGFEKRLVALFLLISVPPTLLIAFFSARYFMQSVQLVSNPGVEQSFTNSMEIARDFSAKLEEDARCTALRLQDEFSRAGSPSGGASLEAVLARVNAETHADFTAIYTLDAADGTTWTLKTVYPANFTRLDRQVKAESLVQPQVANGTALNGTAPNGTAKPPAPITAAQKTLTAAEPVRVALGDPDVIASAVITDKMLFVGGYALERGFADKLRGTADDLGRYRAVGLYVSMKRKYIIMVTTVLVIAGAIASVVFSRLVARRVSHPITELAYATERVAKGDLEHRVTVPARDEILSLVNGFNKMTQELQENRANLIAMAKREAEVARDLQIARQVQESLFPTALPLIPGWEFATTCRTAKLVGGDYHDVFEVAPGKVLFALGDVMGKSVGASLTMASVHAVVRSAGAALEEKDTPLRLAQELNRYLVHSHTSEMFVTLFLGLIDTESSRMWYVNCGHPPALLLRARNGRPDSLGVGGMLLGVAENATYELGTCSLEAGDTLVLVSDGVTEAMNSRDQLYGDERLLFNLTNGHSQGAIETMQRLLDSVDEFAEGAEQKDDISIVVLKRAM